MQRIILVVFLSGWAIPGFSEDSTSPSLDDEAILAFLDEPDSIVGFLDEPESVPEKEEVPLKEPSSLLFTTSFRAGVGYSDNFLKKYAELSTSDYLQLEMDAYATWKNDSIEITAMGFAETTLYAFDLETSDEAMFFTQVGALLSKGVLDFGVESSFLYGSFIYDSSLTAISVASGTQIRQILPTLALFTDWYAPGSNRIRIGISGARADFNLENQDYWDPSINFELEHLWAPSFITTTEADLSRQIYDDDVGRSPDGERLVPEVNLVVNRLALNQRLVWKPKLWKWFRMNLSFGVAWEDEEEGVYEAMRQSWIRGRFTISNYWGRFNFSGKWGEYRYDHRQVGTYDLRLNLQTNRSLTIEYSRTLPWDLRVVARRQWNSLSSRVYQDSYSERRTELLLEWSY